MLLPHRVEHWQLPCCAVLLAVVACAPYRSPCSARAGFDQEVRRRHDEHTDEGPGIVHVPSPANRAELIDTLRAIAKALREAPEDRPLDLNVDIPLAFFEGLSCAQIFAPFGAADFCAKKPREAMLSLYHLPPNWVGGGRELSFHFDENGHCDGARWCATQ